MTIPRVKTRSERSNRQLNAQNMLHASFPHNNLDAHVISLIALLEVLWNISGQKMATGLGEGTREQQIGKATPHSLKGKMLGAAIVGLYWGTGGKDS